MENGIESSSSPTWLSEGLTSVTRRLTDARREINVGPIPNQIMPLPRVILLPKQCSRVGDGHDGDTYLEGEGVLVCF